MFYYLYIIVFIIFIQGNVDTKLNKELGADPDVVWKDALWLQYFPQTCAETLVAKVILYCLVSSCITQFILTT